MLLVARARQAFGVRSPLYTAGLDLLRSSNIRKRQPASIKTMTAEARFEQAAHDICRAAREIGYRPVRFQQMLEELGALETAHQLLASKRFHEGFTKLWELRRLDISLECVVLNPSFRQLFSEQELNEARRRLRELGFDYTRCECR